MPQRAKLASHSVKPVTDYELQQLSDWINQGAREEIVAPDIATTEGDHLISEEDRAFWSFQTPRRPSLPYVEGEVRNAVDAFVLKRLESNQLVAAAEAERRVLIRRAYFDLLGLPPDPAAVSEFVNSDAPDAYEQLIDRLLASPRYGERWGQYWLDLAGYADSEGIQHSDPIRPHAYRYRDYVIQSFNDDRPYDHFLMQQIAGDELADYEAAEVIGQ
ncbi:MAG: DUF1549 domain-containing protein, partial [Planctomycetota bacterium]